MFEDGFLEDSETMSFNEMDKAFYYYDYVREFYGYLCNSLDLAFEDGCDRFDPDYAPAAEKFPSAEGVGGYSNAKEKTLDSMSRAIRAYETMQTIVGKLDKETVDKAVGDRGMMQDIHKQALTCIAELFPKPRIWDEFDSSAQTVLYCDALDTILQMKSEPSSLESAIHRIFVVQKECLEKFLPKKIELLKRIQAEIESSYKGRMDWSSHLHNGKLAVLVARPEVALKTLALNIAENIALDDGKCVVYFNLNYSDKCDEQILCHRAVVDYQKIHGDSLDNFKTEMLMMAFGEIWHSHLHIENPTHLDLTALMRKARLYKRLKELDVLIVDYLHLLDVRFSTNWDETRKMATWTLKNLAKELNIPILLLCPLRRKESNEDWKDLLSDLTEISGITQEADFVWIVDQAYRRTQHEEDREKADVTIVKIPDKTAKRIPLRFTNERGFTSVEL